MLIILFPSFQHYHSSSASPMDLNPYLFASDHLLSSLTAMSLLVVTLRKDRGNATCTKVQRPGNMPSRLVLLELSLACLDSCEVIHSTLCILIQAMPV